jgi:hypothetical protein
MGILKPAHDFRSRASISITTIPTYKHYPEILWDVRWWNLKIEMFTPYDLSPRESCFLFINDGVRFEPGTQRAHASPKQKFK